MPKYHESGTICKAQPGNCPFGDGEHFDTKADAIKAGEERLAKERGGSFGDEGTTDYTLPNGEYVELDYATSANMVDAAFHDVWQESYGRYTSDQTKNYTEELHDYICECLDEKYDFAGAGKDVELTKDDIEETLENHDMYYNGSYTMWTEDCNNIVKNYLFDNNDSHFDEVLQDSEYNGVAEYMANRDWHKVEVAFVDYYARSHFAEFLESVKIYQAKKAAGF